MRQQIQYTITLTRNPENGLWLAKTDGSLYGSPGSPYYAVKTLLDLLPPVRDDKRIMLNMTLITIGAFLSMASILVCVFAWPIYWLVLSAFIIFILSSVLVAWATSR